MPYLSIEINTDTFATALQGEKPVTIRNFCAEIQNISEVEDFFKDVFNVIQLEHDVESLEEKITELEEAIQQLKEENSQLSIELSDYASR